MAASETQENAVAEGHAAHSCAALAVNALVAGWVTRGIFGSAASPGLRNHYVLRLNCGCSPVVGLRTSICLAASLQIVGVESK